MNYSFKRMEYGVQSKNKFKFSSWNITIFINYIIDRLHSYLSAASAQPSWLAAAAAATAAAAPASCTEHP